MATDHLIIGSVVLDDWSAPERVAQGGRHTLNVHKLIGGSRVIHAMGPDPMDLSITGKLWGAGAEATALALNALKDSGEETTFITIGNAYLGVVSEFRWEFVRYPQYAEYSLTFVVSDGYGLASAGGALSSIGSLVATDLGAAVTSVSGIVSTASTAVTGLASAVDAIQPLLSASASSIGDAILTATSAVAAIDGAVTSVGALIDAADPASVMPDVMASTLSTLATNVSANVALTDARGLVGRAVANLEQVVN